MSVCSFIYMLDNLHKNFYMFQKLDVFYTNVHSLESGHIKQLYTIFIKHFTFSRDDKCVNILSFHENWDKQDNASDNFYW